MQEHIYTAKKSRIIKQSLFIWVYVASHIGLNIIGIPALTHESQIWPILLINGVLGMITIPSIVLFLKYYIHSVGKKFIVTYNSLKFVDNKTGETTELNSSGIETIYLVQNTTASKLPWASHEYFSFVDNKKNRIVVTSYIMDITDFWLDTLTRRVNSDKLVRVEKTYPIF